MNSKTKLFVTDLNTVSLSTDYLYVKHGKFNVDKYLDKREGGEVSGDVSIAQHDLNVLSGNYIQTSIPDHITNYASKNAFIQADVDPHYGDSYTGSKAFCVLGLISATNQIKLSGDIQILKDIVDGRMTVGDMDVDINKSKSMRNVFGNESFTNETNMSSAMFSLTLDSGAQSMAFHLSAVDASTGIVTLKEPLDMSEFKVCDGKTQEYFEDLWLNDDNAFYLVGFPEIGNANIPNNFGQFVSGGSVRAIGRQTHVEGRDGIADIRYAHAEGSHCTAAQMASHAEGFMTFAGDRFSHAEGNVTRAEGRSAHAEGQNTIASGWFSHAEGFSVSALSSSAHAEGSLTIASGRYSHAEGNAVSAIADEAHAEGHHTLASGRNSHAEGNSTEATGDHSHASGYLTKARGKSTFTAGYQTVADISAENAFVIGNHSRANNETGSNSFVWQGISTNTFYQSHSKGSFNINPQNGLSGFYIGNNNFIDCVLSAVEFGDYLDKRKGGEVSGDVSIVQHDLNVLSGNYIQTNVSDHVTNYASKNTFIQADVDPHYGDSYAGSKAFCVLGLSSATNQIKLRGDIQILKDIVDGRLTIDDMPVDIIKSQSIRNAFGGNAIKNETNMSAAMFSLTLDSGAQPTAFHLSAVDVSTGIVTLKEPLDLSEFQKCDGKTQEYFEDLWINDDNAFYLVGFPEIGNANIPNNFGQFVSGGSVRAIGRQTHAEGRDSIADVRYAHAEGSHCAALHMASHAEGFRTLANKRYSHAEGEQTKACGKGAHAEGFAAVASGEYSHAEGRAAEASGAQSHASGFETKSKGKNSFTAGCKSETGISADNAFVIGRYSKADDENGSNSFVWQGAYDTYTVYNSHSKGSFNINPQNGLSGFYIGQSNFIQCVLLAVQSMNETQKVALRSALGL